MNETGEIKEERERGNANEVETSQGLYVKYPFVLT